MLAPEGDDGGADAADAAGDPEEAPSDLPLSLEARQVGRCRCSGALASDTDIRCMLAVYVASPRLAAWGGSCRTRKPPGWGLPTYSSSAHVLLDLALTSLTSLTAHLGGWAAASRAAAASSHVSPCPAVGDAGGAAPPAAAGAARPRRWPPGRRAADGGGAARRRPGPAGPRRVHTSGAGRGGGRRRRRRGGGTAGHRAREAPGAKRVRACVCFSRLGTGLGGPRRPRGLLSLACFPEFKRWIGVMDTQDTVVTCRHKRNK
jgi:hypothetical protein